MNAKNLIGGLLAGLGIGVAIGILIAPASGKKTRDDLIKGSRKLTDSLKRTLTAAVEDSVESLKSRFGTGLDESGRMGKEVLTPGNDRIKI
jgi:gas vesicle protein